MEVNKVVYNGDTLLDLTSDTVTPQTLLSGATAHAANGQSISGTVDLNGKADKVANATAGHFAGLDSSGNLTDSGKKASDVVSDASYVHTDNNYTTAEKTKLGGIATGATANTVLDTSCTLAVADWTGASAPYTQTVNVTGVLATDKAWVDLSVSSTVSTGLDEIDDWALISKIESGNGTLTFSCYEDKPTVALTANVKVVR
jgi:hypothetical protein